MERVGERISSLLKTMKTYCPKCGEKLKQRLLCLGYNGVTGARIYGMVYYCPTLFAQLRGHAYIKLDDAGNVIE